MNYFANKNTLIWVIIILLAINVATITTIIIFMTSHGKFPPPVMERGKPASFFNKELGLSPMQKKNFDLIHSKFSEKSLGIIQELDSLRYEMMNELSNEEPDSLKLDKIAEEIGLGHAKLKKETINHFLLMRKTCDGGEQRKALSRIYRSMQEPPERGLRRNWREGENRMKNFRESNNYRNQQNNKNYRKYRNRKNYR